jgi:hypothetical protein
MEGAIKKTPLLALGRPAYRKAEIRRGFFSHLISQGSFLDLAGVSTSIHPPEADEPVAVVS